MPIYEYRCDDCGFQKEYIQRMSDAPLTDCPKCGKSTFSKMVTAAGFQLKGSGWYVTDFRGGGAKSADKKADSKESTTGSDAASTASADSTAAKPAEKTAAKAAESTSSTPAAPAASTSSS